jgi:hypothetical protein
MILAGSIHTATTGARVEIDSAGVRAYNSGGSALVDIASATGLFTLRSAATGARIELDSAGLRAYNSGGTNTVDINSSGSATVTGTIQTGTTGQRIIIDPTGTPTIYFYPSTGANYGWVNSFASGAIEASSTTAGTTRTRMQVGATSARLHCLNTVGDADYGGHLSVNTTAAYMRAYTAAADLRGSVTAYEDGAIVRYGGSGPYIWATSEDVYANNGTGEWLILDGSAGEISASGGGVSIHASGNLHFYGSGSPTEIRLGNNTSDDHIVSESIYNTTNSSAANVFIGSSGWMARSTSSARYKTGIRPHGVHVDAVLRLEPKSWWDKGEVDRNGGTTDGLLRHAGLVAEDVADIPGMDWLLQYDEDGYPDAVAYPRLAVALLPVVRELWARVVGDPPRRVNRTAYEDVPGPRKSRRRTPLLAPRRTPPGETDAAAD